MPETRRDVVFVHIPKTGGTTVRAALEASLQNHRILKDYGLEPQTTPELKELVFDQRKIGEFRNRFGSSRRGILLSGHFPTVQSAPEIPRGAARYWDYFNAESFITFVRNPVDRVYSEYVHYVNHRGWTQGFEKFVRTSHCCNRLGMLLADVDLDSFGFIGFMEELEQSLNALSAFLETELTAHSLNRGDYRSIDPDILSKDAHRDMVRELSREDIEIYERLRKQRGGVFIRPDIGKGVTAGYAGAVRCSEGVATGWLCNTMEEFIAEVEVAQDGVVLTRAKADRYRPNLKKKGVSRSGVCGFRIDLRPHVSAGSRHAVSFKAAGSDYELSGSPLRFDV